MYFMLNLFPCHKFLCLQSLLRHLFLLRSFRLCFRNTVLCSKGHPSGAGELCKCGGASRVLCSSSSGQWPENLHPDPRLSSTLCSFKHVQQILSTLFGPLTLGPASLFGVHTTADSTVVNTGMARSASLMRHLQILGGFQTCRPLMAWAVSWVFLEWTCRSEPQRDFVGFSESRE